MAYLIRTSPHTKMLLRGHADVTAVTLHALYSYSPLRSTSHNSDGLVISVQLLVSSFHLGLLLACQIKMIARTIVVSCIENVKIVSLLVGTSRIVTSQNLRRTSVETNQTPWHQRTHSWL